MIEHISWREGLFMLQECHRILKPGGKIRIGTPNLEILLGMYGNKQSEIVDRYIKWSTNKFLEGLGIFKASFVINNFFRSWGHQFLYDGELLDLAMKKAGFTELSRCRYGESSDEHLNGIESHGEHVGAVEMIEFETLILEGRKSL